MRATLSEIQASLSQIVQATEAVPDPKLGPTERRALGGLLFRRGADFVEEVARALRDRRGRFPDVPVDGAALWSQQERASAWLAYCRVLETLQERARDNWLREQAEAIRLSLRVVEQVQVEARQPFHAEIHGGDVNFRRERGLALFGALRILARRLARRQAGARRKRAASGGE